MKLIDKVQTILGSVQTAAKMDLLEALKNLNIQLEELEPFLKNEQNKPYYRKLLYKNKYLELLVMNWSELECVPHDHGRSHGWIQVINGVSENTVYEVKDNQLPSEIFTVKKEKGKIFFAPKGGVHKMREAQGTNLVTLHLYSPPITGMKVYDLEKCAACVVSDDCGAWWPDEDSQKVKEIKLKKAAE
ncbi:cysteine dioxygenase family protein [Metabacillus idriensis]|uniref:cysteine dioxygenase n=1 Tax=Metabacillus idriensis TaxID=324768 RepID=UPI002813A319|nr:cysteine dioxygenase family protein [Metabacillus idriensis]MDR0137536.1 cysteine dioxygenase family protein [Metabacillus idriensis]